MFCEHIALATERRQNLCTFLFRKKKRFCETFIIVQVIVIHVHQSELLLKILCGRINITVSNLGNIQIHHSLARFLVPHLNESITKIKPF